MNKIFQIKLKTKTDLHITKGSNGPLVETMIFQDNKAIIPGSSLKGLLRWEFERLWFAAHDVPSCNITTKLQEERENACKVTKEKLNGDCPICDIFGTPNTEGKKGYKHPNLKFLDFEGDVTAVGLRSRNSINRDTGETNVFGMKVVPKGTEFVGYLIVTNFKEEWLRIIKNVFKSASNFGLGNSRSSGFGAFEIITFNENDTLDTLSQTEFGPVGNEMPELANWKVITGIIVNHTPMHFGFGKSQGTFHPTLKYIPGQQLRGMFGYYLTKLSNGEELYKELSMPASEERVEGDIKIIFKDALPYGEKYNAKDNYVCKSCDKTNLKRKEQCPKCHIEGSKKGGGFKLKTFISTKNPFPREYKSDNDNKLDKLDPYHIELIDAGQEFSFKCLIKLDDNKLNNFFDSLFKAGIFAGVGGFKGRGYGIIKFKELHVESATDYVTKRAEDLKEIAKNNSLKLVVNSPMVFRHFDTEEGIMDDEKNEMSLDKKKLNWAFCYDKRLLNIGDSKYKLSFSNVKILSPMQDVKIGHWSLRKNDWLDRVEFAIAPGCCAKVVLKEDDFRKAAIFELFGLGYYLSMGYGDFYFCEVEE